MESLLDELRELVEMLESDREVKGLYELSEQAKQYSRCIQQDIEELIDKYSQEMGM